jgi:serine/threonine protein kinase
MTSESIRTKNAGSGLRVVWGRSSSEGALRGSGFRYRRSVVRREISGSAAASRHGGIEVSSGLELPRRFGRFEALACIGAGGAGVVCDATDVASGVRAAVKTARLELPPYHAAIRREVAILSLCSHRGIVSLLDSALDDDRPWFAMELLRGRTLRSLMEGRDDARTFDGDGNSADADDVEPRSSIARRVVPLLRSLRIAEELCCALVHLHERGFAHCDVKPENAFVCEDDRIVLLDFGAARPLGDAATAMEDYWTAFGTWGYLAPECRVGASCDQRADAFALGCVLHELITGVLPPEGRSRRGVDGTLGHISPELSLLVGELTALDCAARPQTLRDCAHRLRELCEELDPRAGSSPLKTTKR